MAADRFVRGDKDKIHQAENTRGYGYANFPPPPPPPPPAPAIEPEPPAPEPPPAAAPPSVMASLLSRSTGLLAVPAGRRSQAPKTVTVGRSDVIVWAERSFLAERRGEVHGGDILTVLEDEDGWLHVRYGTNSEGWVRSGDVGAYQDPYTGLGDRDDLI